jgi:hypothetical protein
MRIRLHHPWFCSGAVRSNRNPLDLFQLHFILPPAIEIGRSRALRIGEVPRVLGSFIKRGNSTYLTVIPRHALGAPQGAFE